MAGFRTRRQAGIELAKRVAELNLSDAVVLGLPRGGVPVAAEVASALSAPLDVIVVRKLGVPGNPELGMGAVAEEGVVVFNDEVVEWAGVDTFEVQSAIGVERRNLLERIDLIRASVTKQDLKGKTAVVVDDGIATGIDARAACRAARNRGARRVVLATPVAPEGWEHRLEGEADDYIAVLTAADFMAVGQFYDDFSPVDDAAMLGYFNVRT